MTLESNERAGMGWAMKHCRHRPWTSQAVVYEINRANYNIMPSSPGYRGSQESLIMAHKVHDRLSHEPSWMSLDSSDG